jgi:hypothetical protein
MGLSDEQIQNLIANLETLFTFHTVNSACPGVIRWSFLLTIGSFFVNRCS